MDALPEPIQEFARNYPFLAEHFPFFLHALHFAWIHPYVTVFAMLYLSGLMPFPEEVTLLLGGYLVYARIDADPMPAFPPSLIRMIATACAAILAGDLTVYWLGRRYGPFLLAHRYARWILSPQNRTKAERFYARWGHWAVLASRFMAGVRVASFLLAGSWRVRFTTFLLMDALGTALSVPVSIWAAYHWGEEIDLVIVTVGRAFHDLSLLVALVAVLMLWWQIRRARRAPPAPPAALP